MQIPKHTFPNGVQVPMFGIGFDQVWDFEEAYNALQYAFAQGYRSVDTASSYRNEEALGKAIRESGLPRQDIYITTKLTAADQGYDSALRAFDGSLQRLGMEYIDCYMIHWPGKYLFLESWRALKHLYEQKLVRVIGVCNFTQRHLNELYNTYGEWPMANQIEIHPYFQQQELDVFCRERDILVEAWSPLMCGGILLKDPVVLAVAQQCSKTPAQVVLRWHHQKGHRVFPKSVTPSRIAENIDIFDFALTDRQMAEIDTLGKNDFRIGPNPDVFFELF